MSKIWKKEYVLETFFDLFCSFFTTFSSFHVTEKLQPEGEEDFLTTFNSDG